MYRGLKAEDYYKYMNTSKEKMMEQYKDTAKKNVLYRLVLKAIMKQVEIPVSDEEINAEFEEMASDAKMPVEDFMKNVNEEYINYVRNNIITTKLFDYLNNNNTIK